MLFPMVYIYFYLLIYLYVCKAGESGRYSLLGGTNGLWGLSSIDHQLLGDTQTLKALLHYALIHLRFYFSHIFLAF